MKSHVVYLVRRISYYPVLYLVISLKPFIIKVRNAPVLKEVRGASHKAKCDIHIQYNVKKSLSLLILRKFTKMGPKTLSQQTKEDYA